MEARLSREVRIKRDENYIILKNIEDGIRERVRKEYESETKALREENSTLTQTEKEFRKEANDILSFVSSEATLKVETQVGPGSTIVREHIGHLAKPFRPGDGYFDMRAMDYNDGKPFTIGFSCLMSIEVI